MKKLLFVICIMPAALSGCFFHNKDIVRADFICGQQIVRFEIQPGSDVGLNREFFSAVGRKCTPMKKIVKVSATPAEMKFGEIGGQKVALMTPSKSGIETIVNDLADRPDKVIRLSFTRRIEMNFQSPADEKEFVSTFSDLSF